MNVTLRKHAPSLSEHEHERDRETSLNRSLVWHHPFKEREGEEGIPLKSDCLSVSPTGGGGGREGEQAEL